LNPDHYESEIAVESEIVLEFEYNEYRVSAYPKIWEIMFDEIKEPIDMNIPVT
jgi:hypothetical protein